MAGISSAEIVRVERFGSIDDMPADALALTGATLFSSHTWWRCVEQDALPSGTTPLYMVCRIEEQPVAMLPLARSRNGELGSLTTPYSCTFPIPLSPSLPPASRVRVIRALLRACRGSAVTRFEALDPTEAGASLLPAAATRAGLLALRFDHFGNWHEDVTGQDWLSYLAQRPGALRETIRRRLRAAERQDDVTLRVLEGPDGLEQGITDYEAVYARSWKTAEPYPRFNPSLMRALASLGTLRLGILAVSGEPVAVQFWAMIGGIATVLKLAHDEAFRRLSPGTVLTAMMIRRLLERDEPTVLDFGRGDDAYKQGWVRHRRQMIGLLLVDPMRPPAWPMLGRHASGRLAACVRSAARYFAPASRTASPAQRSPSDRSVNGPA